MRWTAIVNRAAGRRNPRRDHQLRRALRERQVALHESRRLPALLDIARRVAREGSGLVACGGDGTVAALAELAADAGVPLAVVPLGSGNDFARALGLDPRSPLDALALLSPTAGQVTRLDLGRVQTAEGTTRAFTTVAHVGFDAEVNRRANRGRILIGAPKYLVAALGAWPTYRPRTLRVEVDGTEVWEGRAWLVAVADGPTYGGGLPIAPDAQLRDGRLDVCIVGDVSRRELAVRMPRVLRGTHGQVDGVHTFRGAVVRIEALDQRAAPELWASGERVGVLPATVEVRMDALAAVVPRRLATGRITGR